MEDQLVMPEEWCEEMRELTECMCDKKYATVASYVDDRGFSSDLAMSVDWWTEGLVLPVICLVGILGESQVDKCKDSALQNSHFIINGILKSKKRCSQAGAELGQAQPKLGLDFTLLYLN